MNYPFRYKWIVLTLLLLVSAQTRNLYSQSYLVHTYNENDGLLSSMVFDLTQDNLGRMWFATRGGISMYDGSHWTSYSSGRGVSQLSYSQIAVDSHGQVYALPDLGVFQLSIFNGKEWNNVPAPENAGKVSIFTCLELVESGGDVSVAVGTSNAGIFLYKNEAWVHFTVEDGLPDNRINGIERMERDLIVATDSGLSRISLEKMSVESLAVPDLPSKEIKGISFEINTEEIQRIWMAGVSWLGYLEEDSFILVAKDLRMSLLTPYHYLEMCPDRAGGVYFGNVHNVYHFNKASGTIEQLSRDSGLITEGTTALVMDVEKNIWIGSLRGVSKITSRRFANFTDQHGLLMGEVTAVEEWTPGNMVFGHNNGLTFYDGQEMRTLILKSGRSMRDTQTRVLELEVDHSGYLWAAAAELGLARISPDGTTRWFLHNPGQINQVRSVQEDSSGRLWIVDDRGLHYYEEGRFILHPHLEVTRGIRKILRGPEDVLYLATYDQGIYRLSSDTIENFRADSIRSRNVYSVLVDSRGNTWVGSLDGLYYLEGQSLIRFKSDRFEIRRPVYLILEDSKGRMWFGTDNGVILWDGEESREFKIKQGFVGQETNRGAGLVDSSGNLWIGSDLGVSRYQEEFDYGPADVPEPIIRLLHMDVSGEELPLDTECSLSYGTKNLIFHFQGISFIDENELKFRCMLEGYDEEWIPEFESAAQQIRYTIIPPGRYRFRVQVRNALGVWSEVATSAEIKIRQPFWMEWWFFVVLLGAIGFLSFAVQRYISGRRYSMNLEKEVEERTLQINASLKEKEVMLREIHHRVKNNMQIISSLLRLQANSIDDPEVRNLYNVSQNRIKTMALIHEKLYKAEDLSQIDFREYVESLTMHLFSIYQNESTSVDLKIDIKDIYLDINRAIPCSLIINELVSNSLKHGFIDLPEGEIRIQMNHGSEKERNILLAVEDNGTGFPEGFSIEDSRGLGLHLVTDLVNQLGGSLEIASGQGARFAIRF
ncbi:histidine kinase dimerization/phosphoacceptor domain -containing protein [Acidobacteriota bacterium]